MTLKKTYINILDGPMGTELQKRGLPLETSSDLWNIERPDEVLKVHQSYIDAGAEIICTNTFGSHRNNLKTYDLKVQDSISQAVSITKKAIDGRNIEILGSIGPLGTDQKSFQHLNKKEIEDLYDEMIDAFLDHDIQAILFETLFTKVQVESAFNYLKSKSLNAKISLSFALNDDGRFFCGGSPEIYFKNLNDLNLDFLGLNCTSIQGINKALENQNDLSKMSLRPNAGQPKEIKNQLTYPVDKTDYFNFAKDWIQKGIKGIGGCCGTTPAMISELSTLKNNISGNR